MPLYEIEHIIPLSSPQKDDLARSITQIHSHLFTTPSLFVNVRFTDTANHDVYIGGKKVRYLTPQPITNSLLLPVYQLVNQLDGKKQNFPVRV